MIKDQHGGWPIKLFFSGMIAFGLMLGNADLAAGASTKKDVRKTMSAKQKSDLRKWGLEWCRKNYIRGNAHIIARRNLE